MRCINKFLILVSILTACLLTGCGYNKFNMPFSVNSAVTGFSINSSVSEEKTASAFAEKLCIAEGDIEQSSIDISEKAGAGLFDLNGRDTIYASNIHETMYPASLTKVLTAIVAIKHSNNSDILTASGNVKNLEAGAQVIGIKEGSQLTMEQALNILLIYSANDVSIMIAESVGGSVEGFVDMMNEEARRLGATQSHFSNPHGLSSEDHYTTPYDMYLIMNEAIKLNTFNDIISKEEYQTVYYDVAGNEKAVDVKSTNLYIEGSKVAPSGITVIGGKTGTTLSAGHCLVLYAKDVNSKPYISVVMKTTSRDDLYAYTSALLSKINN